MLRSLNAIRGLAALMVVLSHLTGSGLSPVPFTSGQHGVFIFFMLSGFLMAYKYGGNDGFSLRRFTTARILRVVPLYYLVVIISFAAYSTGIPPLYRIDAAGLLDLLSFASRYSVFWTITVEMCFYAFFAVVWCVTPIQRMSVQERLIFCLLTAWVIAQIVGPLQTRTEQAYYFPVFLAGAATAYGMQALAERWGRRRTIMADALFVVAGLVFLSTVPQAAKVIYGGPISIWDHRFVMCLVSSLVLLSSLRVSLLELALNNSIGDWLGNISYSVYLLHLPIIWIYQRTVLGQMVGHNAAFVSIIACVLLLATVSYRFIEQPILSRRKLGVAYVGR